MSSGKWWPFWLGFDVIMVQHRTGDRPSSQPVTEYFVDVYMYNSASKSIYFKASTHKIHFAVELFETPVRKDAGMKLPLF